MSRIVEMLEIEKKSDTSIEQKMEEDIRSSFEKYYWGWKRGETEIQGQT